ncbi:MAG: hypothetical protein WCC10_02645 [Tumebacillaceae bacterium]
MGDTYISCLFYAEERGEESAYPNAKGASSSSAAFQEVYWRSMLVFFSSSKRCNPDAKHLLFTNTQPPRQEWQDHFDRMGVEIVQLPYKSKPPKGYWGAWQSTFYIIDALEHLAGRVQEDDAVFVLDLDVAVVGNFRPMVQKLRETGFLNLRVDYPEEHVVHGNSRRGLKAIFAELSGRTLDDVPEYLGGEIYGLLGRENIRAVHAEAVEAWQHCQERFAKGQPKFNTEEHLFSYVLWKMDKANDDASPFIKRIWTAATYRNVAATDLNLLIWHLPAEKKRGLFQLSHEVLRPDSRFWQVDLQGFKPYLGAYIGIPRRNFNRFAVDETKAIGKKVLTWARSLSK